MKKQHPIIARNSCESSNVASHGFCPKTNTLAVEYKGGGVYHYPFSAEEYEELKKAKSVGSHIAKHVKPLKFEKIN